MSQKRIKALRSNKAENKAAGKDWVAGTGSNFSYRRSIKANWKFLLSVSVGIVLIFFNALNGDFVSDDYATIPHNPLVANLGVGFKGLNSTNIVKSLIAFVLGVKEFYYHLTSVVFFIVICWLAFLAIEKLFGNRWLSRLTVLIFAVMPIHVEAVSWISGLPYLFIAFYSLLVLLMMIEFLEKGNTKWLAGAVITFFLAFRADVPRIFAVFPLIFLYIIAWGNQEVKRRFWKILPYLLVVAVVGVIWGWQKITQRVNVVNSGYNSSESIFYDPFFQYPTGIAKYLQLFWAPFDLTLYHTMYVFPEWLNWSIILSFLSLMIYFWFRDKRVGFALSFILVTLLPSMSPVKVSWLVAERYAFFPSLGFALFLAIIINELGKVAKLAAPTLLISLLVFYSVRIYFRNDDWSTNHKLWVNTCQVSPNSHNAWNNIGDDYDKLKDYENAIKGFSQSIAVKPNYADAYHNRANIFFKTGRLDLAREGYNIALNFSPSLYQTYLSLIQIDLIERKMDLAIDHVNKLLNLQPENSQAWYAAGLVMAQSGRKEEAIDALRRSLTFDPNNRVAAELLGNVERN